MNTYYNTSYNKVITLVSVVTALSTPILQANESTNISTITSCNQSINYSTPKQSTVDNSKIKNDIEMLKRLEIAEFNDKLKLIFKTSILKTWLPADTLLEKSCLFVKVENQEKLIHEHNDFELELYLALKSEINKSHFFDMIALI